MLHCYRPSKKPLTGLVLKLTCYSSVMGESGWRRSEYAELMLVCCVYTPVLLDLASSLESVSA